MKNLLLRYVKYNYWANQRLLEFIAANCTEEQLQMELVSSFPGIRKTLLHTWGAESIWLMRLQGTSPGTWTWMEFKGTQAELQSQFLENDQHWIDFVESKDENYLQGMFAFKTLDGTEHTSSRSEAIHHCMNHSTFHRGQLVTLLRQAGATKLPATDFIAYCRL